MIIEVAQARRKLLEGPIFMGPRQITASSWLERKSYGP